MIELLETTIDLSHEDFAMMNGYFLDSITRIDENEFILEVSDEDSLGYALMFNQGVEFVKSFEYYFNGAVPNGTLYESSKQVLIDGIRQTLERHLGPF